MPTTITYAKQAFQGEEPATALRQGRSVAYSYALVSLEGTVGGEAFVAPYFEIPVGAKAIAIGPNSEVGQVAVLWTPPGGSYEMQLLLDSRHPLIMDLMVSPGTPATTVIPGVVSPKAVMRVLPFFFGQQGLYLYTGGAGVAYGTIMLELLVYFEMPAQLPQGRPDGGRAAVFLLSGGNNVAFTAAALGRAAMAWMLVNLSTTNTVTWKFSGFTHHFDPTLGLMSKEHIISEANVVAAEGTASYVIQGARFDEYRLYVQGTGGEKVFFNYTLSD